MKSYPEHFKKLFGLIALMALIFAGFETYSSNSLWSFKTVGFLFPFVFILIAYGSGFFYQPIDFDSKFLYVDSSRKPVPLSSIQSIKLTASARNIGYGWQRDWQVIYLTDKLEPIRITPSVMEDSFERFIEAVKKANPSVDADIFEFTLYFGFLPSVSWKPN
ncbi:hypothetical protein [Spirosoma agri]|nr:hypothetical protein [Spirosoma agri]